MVTTELTRRASTIVEDLELWLAGGKPNYPRIAAAHGWPNVALVRENIAALKPLGDLTVTFDVPKDEDPAMPEPTPRLAPARSAPARPAPPAAPVPEVQVPATATALLEAARTHDKAAVRKAAERIDTLLARLRADLQADVADAARRREIAELEARLAELKGKKPPGGSSFPCTAPGCEAVFDTKQGVTMHTTRTHRVPS